MPLPQKAETVYTTDYIYSLPDGQRAELMTVRFLIWCRPGHSISVLQQDCLPK